MISCPNCGLDNLESSKECWNCHTCIDPKDKSILNIKSKDDSEILKQVTPYNTIEIHDKKKDNTMQMIGRTMGDYDNLAGSINNNPNQTSAPENPIQANQKNYDMNISQVNYNPNELIINNGQSYPQMNNSVNDDYNMDDNYPNDSQKSLKSSISRMGSGILRVTLITLVPMLLGVGRFSKINAYELINPANSIGELRAFVAFIFFFMVILFISGLACYFKTDLLASGIKVEKKHALIKLLVNLERDKGIDRENKVTYYEAIMDANILMLVITPTVMAVGFYSLYTPVSAVMIVEVVLALVSFIVSALIMLYPDTISFHLKKDVRDYEGFKKLVMIANIPTVALVIMIVIHMLL